MNTAKKSIKFSAQIIVFETLSFHYTFLLETLNSTIEHKDWAINNFCTLVNRKVLDNL